MQCPCVQLEDYLSSCRTRWGRVVQFGLMGLQWKNWVGLYETCLKLGDASLWYFFTPFSILLFLLSGMQRSMLWVQRPSQIIRWPRDWKHFNTMAEWKVEGAEGPLVTAASIQAFSPKLQTSFTGDVNVYVLTLLSYNYYYYDCDHFLLHVMEPNLNRDC